MNKAKKYILNIRRFFWWSAGVVPSVMEKCPTNQAAYTAVGVIMVFIAILASVSFAFFLANTFAIPLIFNLIGGVIYGLLIYSLDRLILASFRKSEMSRVSIAQRYLLTISLAFIIGEPLLLELFRKEIAFELAQKSQTVAADSRSNATMRFQSEVDALENSSRAVQERLDALKSERDAKEESVIGEIEGVSGSRRKGDGPAAARKNTAFVDADGKYREYKIEAANVFERNNERLREIRTEIENETRRIGAANSEADGILAKHAALLNIITTQAGAAFVYIPLFIGLVLLEVLPLSIKVFGPKTVYDKALEAEELESGTNFEFDAKRRQEAENGVRDRIAKSIAEGVSTDLNDEAERRVAGTMKADILRKIEREIAERRVAEKTGELFGHEIAVEVVGNESLDIRIQLPNGVERDIALRELGPDIDAIAKEVSDGERLELQNAFSSKGHEIWNDLPLVPQLERDRKLILQFAQAEAI